MARREAYERAGLRRAAIAVILDSPPGTYDVDSIADEIDAMGES